MEFQIEVRCGIHGRSELDFDYENGSYVCLPSYVLLGSDNLSMSIWESLSGLYALLIANQWDTYTRRVVVVANEGGATSPSASVVLNALAYWLQFV
jgi:hypothetical protein